MNIGRQYHTGGLTKKQIEYAQAHAGSHRQAAELLNVSLTTYTKYAKIYQIYDNYAKMGGKSLPRKKMKGVYGLEDILAGKYPNYHRPTLKERLFQAGMIKKECSQCGYAVERPDGKAPLVLTYKDGNKNNLSLDNLAIQCYNCYFYLLNYNGEYLRSVDGSSKVNDGEEKIIPEEYSLDNQLSPEEIAQLHDEFMENSP